MDVENEILIVDDSEESVIFLSEILEEHGYKYQVASDGKEAMQKLREGRHCLILLDIMMPGKNGVFVFRDIKEDPDLEKIPVVFVTGASQITGVDLISGEQKPIESFSDAHARGMGSRIHSKVKKLAPDGIIEKPIKPSVLIETIQRLLSQPQVHLGENI